MAGFSISGAISGLDTASIIDGLMSVEANQQTLLRRNQSAEQKAIDAYTALITKLNGVSSAAAAVAKTSAWNGLTATSTSGSVTATAAGTAPGSVTFDVTSIAKAHTLISTGSITSTGTQIASGPITLTRNGVDTQIDVGDGSMDSVVKAINNGSYGVRATAIQTSPGEFKLQLRAATTGSASQFTVAGLDGLAGLSTLSTGSDAQVTVGAGSAAAFTVSSATNTFTDLVPGLSFTVSKLESDVTVSADLDSSKVADGIQKLVDAANDALNTIATQSAWNPTTKTGGVLNGEAAVRAAQQKILGLVGGQQAAGVHLTRDGRLSFNKDEFAAAFKASPEAVAQQFGAQTTFAPAAGVTGSVSLLRAGASARPGSYAVQVTQAAAKEQWATTPPGGVVAGQAFVVQQGTRSISYTAGAGDSVTDAVAALNKQFSGAGLSLTASEDGGAIVFTAGSFGPSSAFTVSVDGAAAQQVTAGRNVAGSINGVPATGNGSVLTGSATAGGAAGLSLTVTATDADVTASGGAVGTVNYASGLAQSFVDAIADLTSATGGVLASAKGGLEQTVKNLQKQIDAWDDRLVSRRAALTKQFTAMELALSSLKSQSSFLSSMPSPSRSNSDS